jgi:lipopolysaccharide export system protein LptC
MTQFTLTLLDTTGIQDYIFASKKMAHWELP